MAIYTRTQVYERLSRRQAQIAVTRGALVAAGRWFADPGTDAKTLSALRLGARPTCLTAAEHHGLWVPPHRGTHVMVRRPPEAATWPRDVITHGYLRRWPEVGAVASVPLLLEHASRCVEPLDLGILVDSALHQGLLTETEVESLARVAPHRAQPVLSRATGLAESGTESKVRLFFALKGVHVEVQKKFDGVGRVDLLVGRRWIIELDSRAHHTGEDVYEYDRGRDLTSLDGGYITSRITYKMVFVEWGATSQTLTSILRSGQHLIDPRRWQGRG